MTKEKKVLMEVSRKIKESLFKHRGVYSVMHEQEMLNWASCIELVAGTLEEVCDCEQQCHSECTGDVEHRYCENCYQASIAEAVYAGKQFAKQEFAKREPVCHCGTGIKDHHVGFSCTHAVPMEPPKQEAPICPVCHRRVEGRPDGGELLYSCDCQQNSEVHMTLEQWVEHCVKNTRTIDSPLRKVVEAQGMFDLVRSVDIMPGSHVAITMELVSYCRILEERVRKLEEAVVNQDDQARSRPASTGKPGQSELG